VLFYKKRKIKKTEKISLEQASVNVQIKLFQWFMSKVHEIIAAKALLQLTWWYCVTFRELR